MEVRSLPPAPTILPLCGGAGMVDGADEAVLCKPQIISNKIEYRHAESIKVHDKKLGR